MKNIFIYGISSRRRYINHLLINDNCWLYKFVRDTIVSISRRYFELQKGFAMNLKIPCFLWINCMFIMFCAKRSTIMVSCIYQLVFRYITSEEPSQRVCKCDFTDNCFIYKEKNKPDISVNGQNGFMKSRSKSDVFLCLFQLVVLTKGLGSLKIAIWPEIFDIIKTLYSSLKLIYNPVRDVNFIFW